MVTLEFFTLILANVANVLIGLFALSRDWRSSTSRIFALLTVSLVGWTTFNHMSIQATNPQDIYNTLKPILFFVVLQNTLFMLFVSAFQGGSLRISRTILRVYIALSIVTLGVGASVGFFRGYDIQGVSINPHPSPVIGLFVLHTLFTISWGIARLVRRYRIAHGVLKIQYKYLIIAGSVLLLLAPITNFILPTAFSINTFVFFGPLYTFAFASLIAYAMFKHRLMDIRFLVARSVAYVLLITVLTLIYVGLVFLLSALFVQNNSNSNIAPFLPLAAALFLTATAPLFKRLFDKLTNQIFYRDAYDPQVFLNQLNRTLVGNIEIGILLRHTASVIEENLKSECNIFVRETETSPIRLAGTRTMQLKPNDITIIKQELATISDKTIVVDQLGDHYADLKHVLDKNHIAVISQLITSYATSKEATAYLMLGPKKSGNAYSKQDIRIIDIITDELLIAIQNALRFEEIQSFNITLQNRINDATSKLKRSNEKLKEMDGTKDEFISMASHQLRTPLTSVKGYLSMVLDGDVGEISPAQEDMLKQAYISSQRMVYLIADLLNVSRLKTGKFIIDKSPTNLAEMVESEIAQLTEVAKGRKLTLTFNKPDDFPVLELDETKTRQVIMNFVDNAIYYTPSGGKIKVELRADRSSVYFMVKDNGLGVPKDEQSHLFSKFYRAKNAQTARPDGTGLGLFMAKKVITEQGGTILFESTEGKGSTFGFKFDRPKEVTPDSQNS